jgi:hypothetical protein
MKAGGGRWPPPPATVRSISRSNPGQGFFRPWWASLRARDGAGPLGHWVSLVPGVWMGLWGVVVVKEASSRGGRVRAAQTESARIVSGVRRRGGGAAPECAKPRQPQPPRAKPLPATNSRVIRCRTLLGTSFTRFAGGKASPRPTLLATSRDLLQSPSVSVRNARRAARGGRL